MERGVFPKKEVGNFYNANFINIKIDMEKGEGIELMKKYEVKAFPTFLFLNSKGEIVHKSLGGGSVESFIEKGKIALDPTKNTSGVKQRYESGDRDPEFIKSYIKGLKRTFNNKYKEIFDWYFYATPKNEFLSKEGFKMLMSYADFGTPAFDFVFKNKCKYEEILNKPFAELMFENKTRDILSLGSKAKKGGATAYENAVSYMKSNMGESYTQIEEYVEWNILTRRDQKYKEGYRKAIDYLYKYDIKEPRAYRSLAIYMASPKTGDLGKELYEDALGLIDRANEIDNSEAKQSYGTQGRLYYALGKKKKGIKLMKLQIENTREQFKPMYEKMLKEMLNNK